MHQGQTSSPEQVSGGEFETEERSGVHVKPRRARRSWLSADDDTDLRWFYANGGASATTRSTTAASLAVIESRLRYAVPCERCGGDEKALRAGTGFIFSKAAEKARQTRGEELLGLLLDPAQVPLEFGDQLCPECSGRGWLIGAKKFKRAKARRPIQRVSPFRVTRPALEGLPNAWPLTSHEVPSGYEMSDRLHSDLKRLGRLSHHLKLMLEQETGAVLVGALAAYFAPDGGTIAALWHLVPAGQKLLRTNPMKLHHSQLFANLRQEQALNPKPNRQALFDAADKQSEKLFMAACEEWNALSAHAQTAAERHEQAIEEALSDQEWGTAAMRVLAAEVA